MEAYPLATHNNALSCKDVTEVTEIVLSSLADPKHAVQQARAFAERFSHTGDTLNHFISKIARHSNNRVELSILSQINTRTEPLIPAQESCDHFTSQANFKELTNIQLCENKVCLTHLLDLIIVLMAAAGSFGADAKETSLETKDTNVPAESEKTANSFKAFSLKIWRKGVKSAGLFTDRTTAAVFEDNDEANNKIDTVATCESNKKENKGEFVLEEIHESKQDESKCTGKILDGKSSDSLEERSSSGLASSLMNTIKHERATDEIATDSNTTHATQKNKQRRKLPIPTGTPGETAGRLTTLVKKLELEKEALSKETNALKSQTETLININASLVREKTETEQNMTQKCKELQELLDEHERNTRQHTFMLNSRLERLQHAKLTADQGCLHLSLRQERFEVYEQQATVICHGLIETVRRELKERHGLFGVAQTKCNSTARTTCCTLDDLHTAGDGLSMYQAHSKLKNYVVELIKRYRVAIQLLTDEDKELRDYYEQESSSHYYLTTVEEGKDAVMRYLTEDNEHYRKHGDVTFGVPLESAFCDAVNYHGIPNHDRRGQSRETLLNLRRNPDKRTKKSTEKHGQGRNLDKEETKSLKDFPSSSGSVVSEVQQYPRRCNSLNTIDVSRHHGQRSCSSIVALVRSGQRSGDMAPGVKTRNIECSACRKNKEQRRRVKKSLSTSKIRGRKSDVHYV